MHQFLHLLFEVGAFVVGYAYFAKLRLKQGDAVAEENRVWVIIGAAAGALIGSRLLGAMEDPALLHGDWRSLVAAVSNRTIVGGLLGGLVGVELTKKIVGVRTSTGDLFTYPLILGMLVGRIGCLLGGLDDNTYGIATELPWGIDLGDGVRRHPTNLYEMLWLGVLWIGLRAIERRWTLVNGARFQLFMVGYLAFRLGVDAIKPQPAIAFGLSSIQWACVLGLLYYFPAWSRPKRLIAHA